MQSRVSAARLPQARYARMAHDTLDERMVRYMVTAALPYAASVPHLGNFAGSVLPADIYYRHLLMRGCEAIFICGSDQHGTSIEVEAMRQGVEPQALADKVHEQTKELFRRLECGFTYYGKTDSDANRRMVSRVFDALRANRLIVKVESIMPYCGTDRRFLADRLIEGTCPVCRHSHARGDQCDDCGALLDPKDLINPYCRICGGAHITFEKTANLAIDLHGMEHAIRRFIELRSKHNWSANAVNKSLSYIAQGLKPREITREQRWGFSVPLRGFEEKVFYVWFDALIAYIGITAEWDEKRMHAYWFDDKNVRLVQFMGKDNIEFHTLMWPAILIGSRMGFTLPYTIKAYEHLTSKTLKFSKSRGVGINVQNALEVLDADYWRFVIAYILPETADSSFDTDRLVEVVNNIMNDKVGNFVHRVLMLIKANRIEVGDAHIGKAHRASVARLVKAYSGHMGALRIRAALRTVVELADMGNALMSNEKPWELLLAAGNESADSIRLRNLMSALAHMAYAVALMLWPFTPEASARALAHFGVADTAVPQLSSAGRLPMPHLEKRLSPMFRKIGEGEIRKMERFTSA